MRENDPSCPHNDFTYTASMSDVFVEGKKTSLNLLEITVHCTNCGEDFVFVDLPRLQDRPEETHLDVHSSPDGKTAILPVAVASQVITIKETIH